MTDDPSKHDRQRQIMRTFWQASRLRDIAQKEAEERLNTARNAAGAEYQSVKGELDRQIRTVETDEKDVRSTLRTHDLEKEVNYRSAVITQQKEGDPRLELERAGGVAREQKEAVFQLLGTLPSPRQTKERNRALLLNCLGFVVCGSMLAAVLLFVYLQDHPQGLNGNSLPISVAQQTQTPAITDLLEFIQQRGYIVVSTDPNFEPQSFLDTNGERPAETKCPKKDLTAAEMQGFDVDVAVAIGQSLGVETCFATPTWQQVIDGNWLDRWDISVGSIAVTQERQRRLDFTVPYYEVPAVIAVPSGSDISSVDQVSGKVVCVGVGSLYEDWLKGRLSLPPEQILVPMPFDVNVISLGSDKECAYAMNAGVSELNGFAGSLTSELSINSQIAEGLAIKKLAQPVFLESFAIAVDKYGTLDSTGLISELNQILIQMKQSGKLADLSNRWFGTDLSPRSQTSSLPARVSFIELQETEKDKWHAGLSGASSSYKAAELVRLK